MQVKDPNKATKSGALFKEFLETLNFSFYRKKRTQTIKQHKLQNIKTDIFAELLNPEL